MTDLENFVKLYKELGIDCVVVEENDRKVITFQISNFELTDDYTTYSDKFTGFESCYSTITFDKEGKLVSQGFWHDTDLNEFSNNADWQMP